MRADAAWLLLAVLLLAAAPVAGVLHWLESFLAHDMAYRLLAVMRVELYRKLDALAPAYLLKRRSGDLVALATVADEIDEAAAAAILDAAVASTWSGPPVWFHGDIAFGNLLVREGRLAAVIDFGTTGIGDPACDVVLAWTLLSGDSRREFRDTLGLDDDTWARGRGWGLWKALITVSGSRETDVPAADEARRVLREILADPVC